MSGFDPSLVEDMVRRQFQGPVFGGAVVAVLSGDGEILIPLGETQAGTGDPVTAATPFHICSCSKAFASAAFARLAEQGLVRWDDRIAPWLPEFQFSDPVANRDCTFRDLAGMRVGIGRDGIAEWGFRQDAPVSMRLERARAMPFIAPFRAGFSYSNLCAIALASACSRISGQDYGEWLENAVLGPLGMEDSWSGGFGSFSRGNPAFPHLPLHGKPTPVPELTGPNSEGSARIYLSGRDALRWIRAWCFPDGNWLKRESIAQLFTPQISIHGADSRFDPAGEGQQGYGFGWVLTRFAGRRLMRSGGGGRGWRHAIEICPDDGIAVAVFASHEGPAVEAAALTILEHLITGQSRDWIALAEQRICEQADQGREQLERDFPSGPQEAAGRHAGTYANGVTGRVKIDQNNGILDFAAEDAPIFDAALAPVGANIFEFEFKNPALARTIYDIPFRAQFSGAPQSSMMRSAYFGDLERVAA